MQSLVHSLIGQIAMLVPDTDFTYGWSHYEVDTKLSLSLEEFIPDDLDDHLQHKVSTALCFGFTVQKNIGILLV